ncbi:hypothetical protein [Methylobacterium indicum]|uniref:Histidine kinase n=1 Tax=Methylobacterium indicum TaxID=1775910 RepID=A0A0J6QUK9_9HYPH|nr:hypothetical protein [Methylobacterium indicum]KMO14540.1 hypothetical protein QR78_23270 [Methylobacterium indicum]KMO26773.1 hypothetical protein QR79_00600 [Methylobacterium indicum]BCM86809.1 hypothetical protein mvi_52700 [Methylobacterium indicum]
MRSLFVLVSIVVALGFVVTGLINGLDDRALARSEREAEIRVGTAVADAARRLGLAPDWVAYCRAETRRKLATYPKDGSIPFGLRYSTAETDEVERAIRERETYERQDQILCLTLLPASLREPASP